MFSITTLLWWACWESVDLGRFMRLTVVISTTLLTRLTYLNFSRISSINRSLAPQVRIRNTTKNWALPCRTTRMAEVFVASFSEDGDSLSQWRAYSSGGVGFSIGFDAKSLIAAHVSDPTTGKPFSVISQLRKVEYLTSAGEASDELLNEAKRLGNAMVWASRQKEEPDATEQPISSAATAALLAILAPIFKHHAFNEERQWRLVLAEVLDQMPSKQFRMGRSTLVPYVEVEPHLKEGYFVKEVIVGPTPHPELSIAALRAFFQSLNHPEVTLHASKVPYRHW